MNNIGAVKKLKFLGSAYLLNRSGILAVLMQKFKISKILQTGLY